MQKPILFIICLCLTYSNAQDTFSYKDSKPDYVVGNEITPNQPNITIEGAIFSILPLLGKGLTLDNTTGIISGIPQEQYQADYTVTLKTSDELVMKANIKIKIWEIATTLTCGIVNLFISVNQTDKFPCKSDKNVKSWSISFNPSGSYPITISNDGILKINKLPPPENPIIVTINAENPAGKSTTSTSITISKSPVEIKSGLKMKADDVNSFTCGSADTIKTVYYSKTTAIDNLDGLDGSDAYSVWDSKLDGFLSSHNVLYWNYTIEGAIYTEEDGNYTFHRNSDYTNYDVFIDGDMRFFENGYDYDSDDFVNHYAYCSVWEKSDDVTKIDLTSGYHTFKIVGHYALRIEDCYYDYFEYNFGCDELPNNSTYKFMLKWIVPGESEEKSIQYYQSLVDYDVVSYLTFDSQYFTMPVNSYFEIPFKVERGKPTECTTGDDRLTVDLSKNVLKGQINEESNLQILVQCSTETSTTNTVDLTIDIVNKYVKGIVAYYLKSNQFDTTCSIPYTPSSDGVKTEIIRLEDEINQEYNPIQSIWDGLTPNFASEFGVNWEGYLKIETAGNYTFNLTSVQGSWLSIDHVELINHKGIHDWSFKTGRKYLAEAYHFIRVNYMKNIGGSGINLLYKNEIDSEFKSLNDNLYFVPRSDFEYRVSYAVYIVNNAISNNIPFIHGDKVIKECVSNPSLPDGLEFYNGCTIRGTPTNVQDEESYVISGNLEDNSIVNSTIQITIIGDIKPQGIHLIDLDNGGISISELKLFIGNESHLLISIDSGSVIYYELPVVPGGFDYNKYTGSITAVSNEYLNNYELEIRAYYSNNEYVSTKIKTSVISGCFGDEKPHFVKVVDSTNPRYGRIQTEYRYSDGTVIQKYEIPAGNTPLYTPALCLIPGDYQFYASDFASGIGTFFFEFYTDGKIADRIEMAYFDYGSFPINTVIKTPIIDFSSKEKAIYYLNEEVKIIPTVRVLDNCEISPELPSFLHFDKANCGIAGTVTKESAKTLYKIVGTNSNGKTTRFLNLTFYGETVNQECIRLGKSFITIHVNASYSSYLSEWSFYLYKTSDIDNENKTSIIELKGSNEGWTFGKLYEYDYCLSNDEYTAEYRTSNMWGFGNGFIDILVNGIPVDRTSLSGALTVEKSFHSTLDYGYNTVWENSIQYEDGWDDPNTEHSTWSKSKLSEINTVSGNVIYIRKIDKFTDIYKYNAFALKVSYISGIIIKVNGREIFRNNLPNGEINPDTKANNIYNSLTDEVFILPIVWLEEDKVIITVELHKFDGENNFPQIDISLLRIIGSKEDCLILNKYTNRVTETNTIAQSSSFVEYGFDENPNSDWYTYTMPGWAIMRFKDHFHTYFNQFSISIFTVTNSPKDFSIEGYYNSEWIQIASFTDITYPEEKKRVFSNYNMSVMYSAIRFTVTKSTSYNFDIYDVNFHLCALRYCKAVGNIPEIATGTEQVVGCRTPGIEGNRTFYCNNDKTWSENENTCNESPYIVTQESEYTFKAGSYYEKLKLFAISGKEVFYSMVTEIDGLRIDNSTGLISGQPYTEQSKQSVYFKASNPYSNGEITIEISITILPSNKPIKIWSNDSIVLEAGNNYNNYRLFYVTGQNIEYKVDKLPRGLDLNKTSGLISGMAIEETLMKCTFTASNDVDYVDITIEINVTLPIKPNNIKYEKEMKVIFGMDYNNLQPYECIAKIIKYSVEPELPDGLKLDKNSGLISGKVNVEPPSSKSYKFACFNNDGKIENPITINIEESVEPVIISHVDNITIEGGKEYDEITLGRVTGKTLVYSIIPNLPSSTLKFDSSKGTISGYISSSFNPVNTTILVSGSGKQVSYTLMLISLIPNDPVVIPSSKISYMKFKFGEAIKSIFLFVAVGTNIQITVNPELPNGLFLDSKSGEIYGSASEYVEKTKYTFTIRNPPSVKIQTVEVEIEFDAIYCESDSEFPKTPAEKGGKEVSIKCGGSKSGMKRRKCLLTDGNKGVWSKIDESECSISSGTIAGIAIGSVAAGLIVIVIIAFCLLRTGIFRKRARSQSVLRRISISDKQNEGVRI